MSEVAVIGAGAWGTALAIQAARAGRSVTLWARDPARARAIAETRRNPRLPDATLPDAVHVTAEMPRADVALIVVPMAHLREVAGRLNAGMVVACCKGLDPQRHALPLEVLAEARPAPPAAVLSGPNFAHEIAAGLPAAAVVAAADADLRRRAINALATDRFRLYGNDDPLGVQLCGAAKNVIAIAAGAVAGAGLGENARAALITRGVAELARLAAGLGGRAETAMGLSGLGDLTLTCTGASSRNYSLGLAIGRGERAADVLAARTTATEGAVAAAALVARAGDLDLPICCAVDALLAERITLAEAIAGLLARPRRDE
jgi:glycerol-3-phosphate dehydrogenase (NAD(P)+)